MSKFFGLAFLRPVGRFLAQWISVSTAPIIFTRERIRLGDSLNFFNAANFFVYAIFGALLAEGTTTHVLGIGELSEPYYWIFILLTSIPFVLICFVLIRLVAPFSLKDVLHLLLYPIGAGVFAGAVFALVASAVVAALIAVGFIPDIKFDFSQWGPEGLSRNAYDRLVIDCLKERSLLYTIVVAGVGDGYTNLKFPFGYISFVRPTITLLYFILAGFIFMAAVDRRKPVVLGAVFLAGLVAAGATVTQTE